MAKNNVKIFYDWNRVKIKIHFSRRVKFFKQGEIWWCNVGQNVGVEINGKKEVFARPVLIYKKLSKDSFLAVPISTQKKEGSWYKLLEVNKEERIAVLSQIKIFSAFRLISKQGKISREDHMLVKDGLKKLYIDSVSI